MGGAWGKRHYDHVDYHEDFIFGQNCVHNVCRRSLQVVSECSSPAKREEFIANQQQLDSLLSYVNLSRAFLKAHHVQEDRHIFPKARDFAKDKSLLAAEEEEHKVIDDQLTQLEKLSKKAGEEELKDEDRLEKIYEAATELRKLVEDHFKREERLLTSKFLREKSTESEVKALNKRIHNVVSEFMDRGVSLVFLVFHLSDQEQVFFDERLPFFVKRFLFPRFASKQSVSVWKLCPHTRLNTSGSPFWGYPVWKEDDEGKDEGVPKEAGKASEEAKEAEAKSVKKDEERGQVDSEQLAKKEEEESKEKDAKNEAKKKEGDTGEAAAPSAPVEQAEEVEQAKEPAKEQAEEVEQAKEPAKEQAREHATEVDDSQEKKEKEVDVAQGGEQDKVADPPAQKEVANTSDVVPQADVQPAAIADASVSAEDDE